MSNEVGGVDMMPPGLSGGAGGQGMCDFLRR